MLTARFPASSLQRWQYALKLASWPKLLVPMLLGQALGASVAEPSARLEGMLFGAAFTVADLVFVVLLNDWFDRDVDGLKRQMFPSGCSPKTIPDCVLPARQVLWGGLIAGLFAIALSLAASLHLALGILPAGLSCLCLFAGYSMPPIRLNYRGGGELLEAVGVGGALPWLNAYAVSGRVLAPEFAVLFAFMALCLASAIASGLSDEESDRRGGKCTVVTLLGNERARRAIELLTFGSALAWIATGLVEWPNTSLWIVLPASAITLYGAMRLRRGSSAAVTNAFAAQAAYKQELHRTIWAAALVVAAALVATA